jgi:hypothetical protein
MVTDAQVRLLRKRVAEGKTMASAAAVAGMSERSAYAWKQGRLPSETKEPRTWRTRPDPFAAVWESEIVPMLVADKASALDATTVLSELHRRQGDTILGCDEVAVRSRHGAVVAELCVRGAALTDGLVFGRRPQPDAHSVVSFERVAGELHLDGLTEERVALRTHARQDEVALEQAERLGDHMIPVEVLVRLLRLAVDAPAHWPSLTPSGSHGPASPTPRIAPLSSRPSPGAATGPHSPCARTWRGRPPESGTRPPLSGVTPLRAWPPWSLGASTRPHVVGSRP